MPRSNLSFMIARRPLVSVVLALGLLAAPACKKDGKGSKAPGRNKADVARAVDSAKKQAKATTLIDFANEDLAKGRYVSASKRAEEALASNPKDADAHAILGAARWRSGDFEGSTSAFRSALEYDPENFGATIGLARNLQTVGQHREAAELQDKLLTSDKAQVDPWLTKIWSYYALADADKAVEALDEVFKLLPADDPLLPLVQAYAAFMRPLAGKGPLCQIKGKTGTSDANIAMTAGMKYTGATVGGEFTRVVMLEVREESIIDEKLAKALKLKELGKFKPVDQDAESGIVIIPAIKFGDLTLENVPAMVQSLEPYEQAMGERPGIVLGRQALQAFGSMAFDFPNRSLTLTKDPPKDAPAGATTLPLLMLSYHVRHAPAVPIRIDGSKHDFYVYFGGVYGSGIATTQKHYFKSGHLPREVDPPDDPEAGLKMVYVESLALGNTQLPGMGGLVMVNDPGDANLDTFLKNTAFELGGYLNLAAISNWVVTYSLPTGKLYIKPAVATGSAAG